MRPTAVLLVALVAIAACSDRQSGTDDVQIAADTQLASTQPRTAGPLPPVTGADAASVMDATEYEITQENLAKFIRASEALSFLRARDAGVRAMLEQTGTTQESATEPLLERLEEHPQIAPAIAEAGMSVRDYYVMAIALANAQRHAAAPEAAPPTPVGRKNAEFVAANRAQLAKLQTWGAAIAR